MTPHKMDENMIQQQVSNYAVVNEFTPSYLQPNCDSVSPKEVNFHILDDNSQDVSILDIGFGAGNLWKMVKSNPVTSHWHIDGVDGWEPNC
jgi:tRNA G46 methylase TrmB